MRARSNATFHQPANLIIISIIIDIISGMISGIIGIIIIIVILLIMMVQVYYTTTPNKPLSQWDSQFVDNNKLTTISDLTPHTIYTIRLVNIIQTL